jgi:PleD family two-component response regulator
MKPEHIPLANGPCNSHDGGIVGTGCRSSTTGSAGVSDNKAGNNRGRCAGDTLFNILPVETCSRYRQTLVDILLLHFPLIGVDEAGDGWEALGMVQYRRPDLIFMDIQLHDEDGLR